MISEPRSFSVLSLPHHRTIGVAFLIALGFLLGPTAAQTAWVLDGGLPGITHPTHTPSAAFPAGAPSALGPRPLPNFGLVAGPPAPVPAGGHAIDPFTFTVYSTNGALIQTDKHPAYILFLCPGGGICPPPPAVAAPVLLGGGPITGLAIDSVGGILYMCDAISFQPFALNIVPAPIPLGPPLPLPAAAPLSGLGFEPGTGNLWACDVTGGLINFTPAGGILAQFPPIVGPAGPIGGLAINTTNGQPGDTPPPACSQQLGPYHVLITDGLFVYDALTPNPPIRTTSQQPMAYGLAFSQDPQPTPSASPQNRAQIYTTRPTYAGNGPAGGWAFGIRVYLTNNPTSPIGPVLLLDLCPSAPIPAPWGGNLCVNPATSLIIAMPPEPNLPGSYLVRLPLNLAVGLQATSQCVYFDPMAPPAQISHTGCMTLTMGRL